MSAIQQALLMNGSGGKTWKTYNPSSSYVNVASISDDGSIIVVAIGNTYYASSNIVYSNNGGESFSSISGTSQPWNDVYVNGSGDNILLSGYYSGKIARLTSIPSTPTYTTTDNTHGVSMSATSTGNVILLNSDYSGTILCSTDYGSSFSSSIDDRYNAVVARNGVKVAWPTSFTLRVSTNNATTYTEYSVSGAAIDRIAIVDSAAATTGRYYGINEGDTDYVYYMDNLRNWYQTGSGQYKFTSISCSRDGIVVAAASSSGIHVSRDSGMTWSIELDSAAKSVKVSDNGECIAAVSYGGSLVYYLNEY